MRDQGKVSHNCELGVENRAVVITDGQDVAPVEGFVNFRESSSLAAKPRVKDNDGTVRCWQK